MRERPELDLRQAYYLSAYQLCARGRQVSMGGPLAIAMSEILAYCEMFNITQVSERDRLLRYVMTLDNAYLEFVAEKQEKESSK